MDETAAATPHFPIDPTDIIALVVLVIASLRRLDVKVTERAAFPAVGDDAFRTWRERAEGAYALVVRASMLKIFLNNLWFFGMRRAIAPQLLAVGGALIFIGWVVAVTVAWRRSSSARRRQAELGIVLRRKASDA